MFIKWRHEHQDGYTRHYAYAARSKRVGGSPRQKALFLGSIVVRDGFDCFERVDRFWFDVIRNLARAEIQPHRVREIVSMLEKRVQFLTWEEWEDSIPQMYREWKERNKNISHHRPAIWGMDRYYELYVNCLYG